MEVLQDQDRILIYQFPNRFSRKQILHQMTNISEAVRPEVTRPEVTRQEETRQEETRQEETRQEETHQEATTSHIQ
jgi:hypothetical protein